jgi:protease secretion system membrane fusion protein
VKEEYAPRNRQLELERQEGDIQSSIADMTGQIVRAQRAIAEARQRKIFRREEYRKEIESQFTDVRREMSVAAERYRVAKEDLGRIDIKSPVTGQVVGLAFPSPGAVVAPGQKLMDVVPEGQSLLVEAHVAPHLIDRVHKGMSVDVRFSSFAKTPQLVVAAKVTSVSTDLLTDPSGNNPHYLARVTVTPEGYKVLANRVLQPGMPVEVIFVTGERSMLTYLLNPLLKRIAASMKEE